VCNTVMLENQPRALYLYEATRAADASNRSREGKGYCSPDVIATAERNRQSRVLAGANLYNRDFN
jgi:hypothetical protein